MLVTNSVITGTGSYVPSLVKKNDDFLQHNFLNEDGTPFEYDNPTIIEKFKDITGIVERRYATPDLNSSDLGHLAAEAAIADAGINREKIDYIIVAHNFGDVKSAAIQSDILPSLASRIKQKLGIKNPNCVAYDILFGCPGWIEGVIQAHAFLKSGMAKKVLVIGTETLSRVVDPTRPRFHDLLRRRRCLYHRSQRRTYPQRDFEPRYTYRYFGRSLLFILRKFIQSK
jgi:3-oxoacyl-[acyl-carrier-protein] synthase-3